MVLDKMVEQEIAGQKYNFCLPIKLVFKAERELVNKNLLTTVANYPFALEDLYTLFKYAYIGGDNAGKNHEEVYYLAADELGLPAIYGVIMETLQKSGVLGTAKKA
jgi:hypothetical protein